MSNQSTDFSTEPFVVVFREPPAPVMNHIKRINDINQKELDNNVGDSASWHADYRDTAYIYVGNLPKELQEKDIVVIFSQFGVPTHINLIRDRNTGEPRGFCYLKFEDYRSCILAVDNFNGVRLLDRPIRVDHTYFKLRDGETEDMFLVDYGVVEIPEREKVKAGNLNSSTRLLEYKPRDRETRDHRDVHGTTQENNSHDNDAGDGGHADDADKSRDPSEMVLPKEDDVFKDPMAEYLGSNSIQNDTQGKKRHHRHHHRSSRDHKSSRHRSAGKDEKDDSKRRRREEKNNEAN